MAKLMIIDDDEINNFTVEAMLERIDFVDHYQIRDSGESALTYLKEAVENNTFPDYIFVDINMPIMNGFQFLEQYEQLYKDRYPDTHICMLSSSMNKSDEEKSLSYHCVSRYETKPLNKTKLEKIVLNQAG